MNLLLLWHMLVLIYISHFPINIWVMSYLVLEWELIFHVFRWVSCDHLFSIIFSSKKLKKPIFIINMNWNLWEITLKKFFTLNFFRWEAVNLCAAKRGTFLYFHKIGVLVTSSQQKKLR